MPVISKETKAKIVAEFAVKDGDTGSAEVQIALLTESIKELTARVEALEAPKTRKTRAR